MKVAIALFVKNEQKDIASWLSWHLAIGVNKFFIFDDHSTDGTYEILKAATTKYEIELNQTNIQNNAYFYWRQKDCFLEACQKAKDQGFDWIGFLDSDEYLSLEENITIQDFLKRFDQFNAVALNWRIFGSNNKAFKSDIPVYENFIYHSDTSLGACALVKSFIRPQDYTFQYRNPHQFHTKNERYADALGNPIEWGSSDGTSKNIIWEPACINHYICRSMEHYIERVKRRRYDMINFTGYWETFNKNNIHKDPNKLHALMSNKELYNIKKACVKSYIDTLNQSNGNLSTSTPLVSSNFSIVSLKTTHDTIVGIDKLEGNLKHFHETDTFIKLYGVIYNTNPDLIYLFYLKDGNISNVAFNLIDDLRFSSSYLFLIEKTQNKEYFSLKSPKNNQYMSFEPLVHNNDAKVNKSINNEWEYLTFHNEYININFNTCPKTIFDREDFLTYLRVNYNNVTYEDFILALNTLNDEKLAPYKLTNQLLDRIIDWL